MITGRSINELREGNRSRMGMRIAIRTVIKPHAFPMGKCNQTPIMVRNGYLKLAG